MNVETGWDELDKMPPGHTDYSLFPEYEFVYDDYYVNSYEWYSHDSSYCAYEVDKSAFYANVLRRIPVSTAVVIILLKTDTIWRLNG